MRVARARTPTSSSSRQRDLADDLHASCARGDEAFVDRLAGASRTSSRRCRRCSSRRASRLSGLLATHGDWDHLLGRARVPGGGARLRARRPRRGCAPSRAPPSASCATFDERALRRARRAAVARPGPGAAGARASCELGRARARAAPGRRAHRRRHGDLDRRGRGVLVCGDYLSPVEIPMDLARRGSVDAYLATLERLAPLVERADTSSPATARRSTRARARRDPREDVAYLQALRERRRRSCSAATPAAARGAQREIHAENVYSAYARADHRERVAGGDRGALGDRQLGDRARLVGGDLVLHLHRLDDADELALLDGRRPARRAPSTCCPAAARRACRRRRRRRRRRALAARPCARGRSRRGRRAGSVDRAAGERRPDHLDVEALARDLDRVGLLDRLGLARPRRRRLGASGTRASSATACPRSGRGRSRRWPTARSPAAPCGTGSASSGPRSRTRRSARSIRCVACSRSASQTISLATIGSYIGEISRPGARRPSRRARRGPHGSR